jgi:hypothetical protein
MLNMSTRSQQGASMPSIRTVLPVLLVLVAGGSAAYAGDYIWIEGEDAERHSMRRHGWYDSVAKENLSGGEWLSHFAEGDPPEAEFSFELAESGAYFFWIRANSVAAPRLSFRLDHGAWKEVDLGRAIENLNIASDGKPDMRFISWINAGKLDLSSGRHTIGFRFHSKNHNHGGLDCFVLSRRPFMPRGALKPGVRTGKANPGFFAWEPEVDEFRDDALLDLRYLNEVTAGQDGRVRAEGHRFVLGSGEKAKFWGVNVGPGVYQLDHASHAYLARNLAKRGVNLVRLHGGLYAQRDPTVDRRRLDDLHHLVAVLKQEGIYVKLSFYFPLWFKLDGDRHPFMLLYFDPEMQKLYFQWADALLRTPNPYTGMSLGADPGVAIVEVVNEDSHFFWTFGKKNMPEARWQRFTRLYADWLKKKYGSLDRAVEAWGGVRERADRPDDGRMELYDAWAMTGDGLKANAAKRKRIGDQVQFLTENMRGFYQRAAAHFREKCGYDGLVSCSNWHVADARTLDALERYCYTAGDVIDRHGYYDHNHKGEAASWSVRPEQTFRSQSALHLREPNPLPYVETEGYPHITSEIGWPLPNTYRAEAAFLTATYGSLQGLDGVVHFAVGSPSWDRSARKFALNTPVALGSYFAAALAYRRDDVEEASAVVKEHLRLEDLYAMKGSRVFVGASMDQLRAAQAPEEAEAAASSGTVEGFDPLAFYVGRVVRSFEGHTKQSTPRSVARFIDRDAGRIRSATGELVWDYAVGFAAVNTPRLQGVAGFLGSRGPVRFGDVRIDMKNEYGTVMVIALDDRPLSQSDKILIQCMTIDQLHGWSTTEDGGKAGTIEHTGSAPWGMEKIDASVSMRYGGGQPPRVVACDENGYPTDRNVDARLDGGTLTIEIDEASAYTVVQR